MCDVGHLRASRPRAPEPTGAMAFASPGCYQGGSGGDCRGFVSLAPLVLLIACAPQPPMSVERAMAACEDRAYAATRPTGSIGIGVGNRGVSTGISIGVSSDLLAGRDPAEVYETCVIEKSGYPPTRPWIK